MEKLILLMSTKNCLIREQCVRGMEGYYLSKKEESCFEIDLNISKKNVLVSIARGDIEFFINIA